jgi:hypothetical protein
LEDNLHEQKIEDMLQNPESVEKEKMLRNALNVRSKYLTRLLIAVPLGIASWFYPCFTDKITDNPAGILASLVLASISIPYAFISYTSSTDPYTLLIESTDISKMNKAEVNAAINDISNILVAKGII